MARSGVEDSLALKSKVNAPSRRLPEGGLRDPANGGPALIAMQPSALPVSHLAGGCVAGVAGVWLHTSYRIPRKV
jgi:hypothetical protein